MRACGPHARAERRRARVGTVLGGLLAVAMVLGGCSDVPSSGPVHVVRSVDAPQPATPLSPQPGQPADQIVRDFVRLSANTSHDVDAGESYAAARQYLTDAASAGWQRPAGSTPVVILADDFRVEATDRNTFRIVGTQVGRLDADRSYHAVENRAYTRELHLTRTGDLWRITDPPPQLVITSGGFRDNYYSRNIYFLNRTGTTLVPDPRYVTLGTSDSNQTDRLVRLLMHGPSSSVSGSATSEIPAQAQLRSNVTVADNGNVLVDLTDMDVPDEQSRLALAAQLAWTVDSEGTGVQITVNGEPLDPQTTVYTTANTASLSPDRKPGSGSFPHEPYYIDPSGRIIALNTGESIWGRLGRSGNAISAAMSAANGTLAAVAPADEGQQLLIGRPLELKNAEPVLSAQTLTTPTFDRSGSEVWVVQDGATKPQVVRLTTTKPVARQVVQAPQLTELGEVTALELSPDGARVAVVAGGSLYLGAITPVTEPADEPKAAAGSNPEQPSALAITGLTEINPWLTDVGPVAFWSADELWVGAKSSGGSGFRSLLRVSVDGREITPVSDDGIYGDVTAIALESSTNTQLISFDGRVWKLSGSVQSGVWASPNPETSVVEGSAPFVPN